MQILCFNTMADFVLLMNFLKINSQLIASNFSNNFNWRIMILKSLDKIIQRNDDNNLRFYNIFNLDSISSISVMPNFEILQAESIPHVYLFLVLIAILL